MMVFLRHVDTSGRSGRPVAPSGFFA